MRHGKKVNHLGRKAEHRKAMLSNMACSLIEHKRISTTIAKAKALRVYVEPIITKSKDDSTHNRRTAFSYLKSKEAVTELFRTVAPKVADRPGGYTRIIRTGYRLGDNAEMCMIELVDFNEVYTSGEKKTTTRRSRRGGSGAAKATTAPAVTEEVVVEDKTPEDVEDAKVVETAVDGDAEPTEASVETLSEEVVEEAPAADEAPEASNETEESEESEEK
jgi:large subunit ribosomal protein L17